MKFNKQNAIANNVGGPTLGEGLSAHWRILCMQISESVFLGIENTMALIADGDPTWLGCIETPFIKIPGEQGIVIGDFFNRLLRSVAERDLRAFN